MDVQCKNCNTINNIPHEVEERYRCGKCGAYLPEVNQSGGDTSSAVGLIGGAALGAAIGGPIGAMIGGFLGALLGKEGKGLG